MRVLSRYSPARPTTTTVMAEHSHSPAAASAEDTCDACEVEALLRIVDSGRYAKRFAEAAASGIQVALGNMECPAGFGCCMCHRCTVAVILLIIKAIAQDAKAEGCSHGGIPIPPPQLSAAQTMR